MIKSDIVGLIIVGGVVLSTLVAFRIFGVLGDRYNHLLGVFFGPLRFVLFIYLAYYGIALALAVRSSLKERYLISGGGAILSAAVIAAAIFSHFDHALGLSYARRGGVIADGLFVALSKVISPTGAVIAASISLLTFASDLAGYGPLTILRKKRHLVADRLVDTSRGSAYLRDTDSRGTATPSAKDDRSYIDLDSMGQSFTARDFEAEQSDLDLGAAVVDFNDEGDSIDERGSNRRSIRHLFQDRIRDGRTKAGEGFNVQLGGESTDSELYDQFSSDAYVPDEFDDDDQVKDEIANLEGGVVTGDYSLSGHLVQELHFEGSIDLRPPNSSEATPSLGEVEGDISQRGTEGGSVQGVSIYDYVDEEDAVGDVLDLLKDADVDPMTSLDGLSVAPTPGKFGVGEASDYEGSAPVDDEAIDMTAEDLATESDSNEGDPSEGKVEWKLPSPTILKRSQVRSLDKNELWNRGTVLCKALASHKVETTLVGMTVGPTVTRYELELGAGVKVSRVTSLHKDIAYAMAAADVRILAPIPGRSAIGVEVPNEQRLTVSLGDVLSSPEAAAATHPLAVAIGRDISGKATLVNLAEMPHVLIAGSTGSGKSSCLNSILTSLLVRSTPDQVRMILVDPKRVELGQYNGVPHLLTPVVTEPKKAANALNWAVREMESRYNLLSEIGARDLASYNLILDQMEEAESIEIEDVEIPEDAIAHGDSPLFDSIQEKKYRRLPYIVVVVDELNDLMMVAAKDVEESICRIAQMARAVGIHLVIATQRPSVDVITGLIKANIPSRMAFSVSSLADSRVILDQPGAERLIGKGDMLMLGASSSHPQRLQAPWVSEDEVRKVVATWLRQGKANFIEGLEQSEEKQSPIPTDDDGDELFNAAVELVVMSQLGSTTMLQRKLRIGFSRAGRLMDLLENRGIVGPQEGSRPRIVLLTKEEFENEREAGGF